MTRTAEASNWKHEEDQVLYSIITKAIRSQTPMSEAYQEAADFFNESSFSNREPNACRQRWSKIKNIDSFIISKPIVCSQSKESHNIHAINLDVPVTTGIQQEINFESGVLMDASIMEDYPVQEEEEQLQPVQEDINFISSPSFEDKSGFIQLRDFIDQLEKSHMALEKENLELRTQLEKKDLEIEEFKKEVSTFKQVKALLGATM